MAAPPEASSPSPNSTFGRSRMMSTTYSCGSFGRAASSPELKYGRPQVNPDFAARTWYGQSGARGLHEKLGFSAPFVRQEDARGHRTLPEDGWDARHHISFSWSNPGRQITTRSFFDRPLQPSGADHPIQRLVPTWKLAYEPESGDKVAYDIPQFEPFVTTRSTMARPAWSCRHRGVSKSPYNPYKSRSTSPGKGRSPAKGKSPSKGKSPVKSTPPKRSPGKQKDIDQDPSVWNSNCHNGMRYYFDGKRLPDFQIPIL